jgi:release factor glutamine methyltransferase
MKNSKEIFRDLLKQITIKEDQNEIQSILYLLLEEILGLSRAAIIAEKSIIINEEQIKRLQDAVTRINKHEPIQYILKSAYFFGRKFTVNPTVLIPRPETELLIEEVLSEIDPLTPGRILDIGTGSGCIAITLVKEVPGKHVLAIDVSEKALQTANENAHALQADVDFLQLDALKEDLPAQPIEIIVSNPPYIARSEKNTMKENVLNHEPHLALFAPDNDPLIFYRTIAQKGFFALRDNGKVYVEINERFGKEVAALFSETGFQNVRIVKDLQEKDRIVVATKL